MSDPGNPPSPSSSDSLYRLPPVRLSSQQPRSPEPSNAVPDGELSFTGSPATPDPLIGKYCKNDQLCAAHSHVLVMLPVRPEPVLRHSLATRRRELRSDSEEEHMVLTQLSPDGK